MTFPPNAAGVGAFDDDSVWQMLNKEVSKIKEDICELRFTKNLLCILKTSERKEQEKACSHSTEIFKRSTEASDEQKHFFTLILSSCEQTCWLDIHTQVLNSCRWRRKHETTSNPWSIEGFHTQCRVYDQFQAEVMVKAAQGVKLHLY